MFKQVTTEKEAVVEMNDGSKVITPTASFLSMDGRTAHLWKEGGIFCVGPVTGIEDENLFQPIIEALQYLSAMDDDTTGEELLWLNLDPTVLASKGEKMLNDSAALKDSI